MAILLSTSIGLRSSGASLVMPFDSANSGGSLLTLTVGAGSSAYASTVTDSAGNTWLLAVESSGTLPRAQIWYAANAIGSTNTVTVTNAAAAVSLSCFAQEWSGCSTASPLLATSGSSASASTHTPGAVSVDVSTALFLVNYSFANAFDITTGPSGYTEANSTFTTMQTFYKAVSGSTTTAENPEAVSSAAELSASIIAAFAGGSAPVGTSTLRRKALSLMGVS